MTGTEGCSSASAWASSIPGIGSAFRSQKTTSTPPRRAISRPASERLALITWADSGGPDSRLPNAATKSGCRSMTSVSTARGNGVTTTLASADVAGTTTTLGTVLGRSMDGNGIVVLRPRHGHAPVGTAIRPPVSRFAVSYLFYGDRLGGRLLLIRKRGTRG